MKFDLTQVDTDNFAIHLCTIAGEQCYLVFPIKGAWADWTKDNLIQRSSMWNMNGEPVSLSYKKFFNWDEQPETAFQPKNFKRDQVDLVEKIDGSTLIVSKYKGELITRTRGTTSAYKLDNGFEIDMLKQKYPKAFAFEDESVSYIYEWVSPINKIVLNYGEDPDMYLTGVIRHKDYSLVSQSEVDEIAKEFEVKRPARFNFSSIEEMLKGVEALKGQEGLCCYCNNGQDIRKVKSAWYLALHRMKSELGSYEKVMDLYFTLDRPSYTDFYNYVMNTFDFELAEQAKSHMSKVCDGMKEVNQIMIAMKAKAESLKHLPRKDAALRILADYGETNRSGMVFSYLDGKDLKTNDMKKLLFQVSKM